MFLYFRKMTRTGMGARELKEREARKAQDEKKKELGTGCVFMCSCVRVLVRQ